ncbi:MAG: phosphatidate cytidylyltransferase [Solirubrobacterales bacterium]
MEGSRPFDAELDFDHARRSREPPPPDLPRRRRGRGRRPPRQSRSETVARIAWAVPWIAIALTVIIVGGIVFAAAMIAFACIGMVEFFRMTRSAQPFIPIAFAAAAAMIVAAYYGTHFQIVIAFVCVFPVMFAAAVARPSRDGVMIAMAVTVFGIAWIGVPFAHAVLLRQLPDHGAALLLDVVVATFVSDTAAYAGGRMFGRHRLAPALSPNKTLEGLAFGFVGGAMGFWFAGLYQDWMSGLAALAIGVCVAALAPIGDLFESMIKRDLAVKDSGTVFGPHGGILDRLDAILFTIVAGYYLSVALVY